MDQWWPWNLWCNFSLLLRVGLWGIYSMKDQGLQWAQIFCSQDCQIIHIGWFIHRTLLLLQRKLQHQISMRQISTLGVTTDQWWLQNLQYISAFLSVVVSWGIVSLWDRGLQKISYLTICNCRGWGWIFKNANQIFLRLKLTPPTPTTMSPLMLKNYHTGFQGHTFQ